MHPRRIHKNNLRRRMYALLRRNLHHPRDTIPRGLRLSRDDGHFFAGQRIQQRAFAGIRPAQNSNKSRFQGDFQLLISIIADSKLERCYHHPMIPAGQTERLILRPLELADAEQIQALFPHWEIVRYLLNRVP